MPAFRTGHPRTRVYQVANVAVTAGSHAPWAYDGVSFDDDGQYDGAGTITIQRSGLYTIHCGISRATGGGTQEALSRVLRSGTAILEARTPPSNGTTSGAASDTVELAAGDTITASVQLDTVNTRTLRGTFTFLTVVRTGPVRYTGN